MTSLVASLPAFGRALQRALWSVNPEQRAQLAEALARLAERETDHRFANALNRAFAPIARRFTAQLAAQLARLGQHVAEAAQNVGGLLVESAEPSDRERSRVDEILAASRLRDWADRHLRPVYGERYLRVAEVVVETVNAQLSLGVMLPDPVAQRVIAEGGRRVGLLDLAADTREALFRTIELARLEGLGPPAVARLIRSEVPAGRFVNAGPRYRAELIARTETLHAQRFSSLEVYRSAETVVSVQMWDNLSGFGDSECVGRDGQIVSFDRAEYEMASTHPACTLGFAPVVAGAL